MYFGFEAIGKQVPVHNYPSPIEGSLDGNMCLWMSPVFRQTFLSSLREEIGLSIMKTAYHLSVVILKQS